MAQVQLKYQVVMKIEQDLQPTYITKQVLLYVDQVAQGLDTKPSCRAYKQTYRRLIQTCIVARCNIN